MPASGRGKSGKSGGSKAKAVAPPDADSDTEPEDGNTASPKKARVMTFKDAITSFNAKRMPLVPGNVVHMATLAAMADQVKFEWYMADVGPKHSPVPAVKLVVDGVNIIQPPTAKAPYCDILVDMPPCKLKFFTGGLGEAFWRNSEDAPRAPGAPFYPVPVNRLYAQMVVDISATGADEDLKSGVPGWKALQYIVGDSLGAANFAVITGDDDVERLRTKAFAPGSSLKDRKAYTDQLVKEANRPKDPPYLPCKLTKDGVRRSLKEAVAVEPAQPPDGASKEEDKKMREVITAKTNFFGYVEPGQVPPPNESSISRAKVLVPEDADGRGIVDALAQGGFGPLKIMPLFRKVPGEKGHVPVPDDQYEAAARNARGGVMVLRLRVRIKPTKDGSIRTSVYPESATILKDGPNAVMAAPEAGAEFPDFA